MNIVTPTPTAILFPTNNVSNEAVRRDNQQRETIPQTANTENSAAESGVGSESDRVKTPGQQPQLTYERPQAQQNSAAQNDPTQGDLFAQDNAEDPSAGKENAESKQQQQQELAEKREVDELKSRDQEVRAHEQAHAAVGGQYASSPTYEFESGPDGRRYAVGGEVSIDISKEDTPEETIRKMQQVRAAALAPADPSPQDLRVAGEAANIASDARADIAREKSEQAKQSVSSSSASQADAADAAQLSPQGDEEIEISAGGMETPSLDEIVDGMAAQPPTRSLDNARLDTDSQRSSADEQLRTLAQDRDSGMLKRVSVIQQFYQNVSQPRADGVQQSA